MGAVWNPLHAVCRHLSIFCSAELGKFYDGCFDLRSGRLYYFLYCSSKENGTEAIVRPPKTKLKEFFCL